MSNILDLKSGSSGILEIIFCFLFKIIDENINIFLFGVLNYFEINKLIMKF
jgi:hypothetical protein